MALLIETWSRSKDGLSYARTNNHNAARSGTSRQVFILFFPAPPTRNWLQQKSYRPWHERRLKAESEDNEKDLGKIEE